MKLIARENNISARKCAFCKNWYDPTNSAIKPGNTMTMWEYDPEVKYKCRIQNRIKKAFQTCSRFESKI